VRKERSRQRPKGDLLFKGTPLQLKDLDRKSGVVVGYFSTKHVKDSVGDIILDGAYKRTINSWGPRGKNRIKVLRQHNPTLLLGRPLVLEEDDIGLYHESKISKTSLGLDTLTLLEDGVITEQSIGYDIVDGEFGDELDEDGWPTFFLREIRLWEGSFVTWGANEVTPILEVRSNDAYQPRAEELLEQFQQVQKCLRNGDWQTDEVPEMLELTLKGWEPLVRKLQLQKEEEAAKSLGTTEDSEEDPSVEEPTTEEASTLSSDTVEEEQPENDDDSERELLHSLENLCSKALSDVSEAARARFIERRVSQRLKSVSDSLRSV